MLRARSPPWEPEAGERRSWRADRTNPADAADALEHAEPIVPSGVILSEALWGYAALDVTGSHELVTGVNSPLRLVT